MTDASESYEFDRYAPAKDHWYVPSAAVNTAVNTALVVDRPLLVTGEPGSGKTTLAWALVAELGLGDVLTFHTRSDHQARDCALHHRCHRRFYDAQVEDPRVKDPGNYVTLQALGEAIASGKTRVVLIDEIDKAPRDFPNDLLDVVEQMRFEVREPTSRTSRRRRRARSCSSPATARGSYRIRFSGAACFTTSTFHRPPISS